VTRFAQSYLQRVDIVLVGLIGLLACGEACGQAEKPAPAPAPAANQAAREARETSADEAWLEFVSFVRTLPPPSMAPTAPSAPRELENSLQKSIQRYVQAADKAKEFHVRFPTDERALQARLEEYLFLVDALQSGSTSHVTRLDGVEKSLLDDRNIPEQVRLQLRVNSLERMAAGKRAEGFQAVLDTYEQEAWKLQKDFPQRPESYALLLKLAQLRLSNDHIEKARAIAQEVVKGPAPPQIRIQAEMMLKHFGLLDKSFKLKFTAIDGREVDIDKMRGKVVLIDFWATWCQPCLAEIPNLTETYRQLNPKGFEIIGINLDESKANMNYVMQRAGMTWPQHFDGQGTENKFAQEFGVALIPTMWLVDKEGVLRNLDARTNLRQKVEKLLAEKSG